MAELKVRDLSEQDLAGIESAAANVLICHEKPIFANSFIMTQPATYSAVMCQICAS
jgi:hypothetical protein